MRPHRRSYGKNHSDKLNKPIQIGMSILDLSKTLMYRFPLTTTSSPSGETKRRYCSQRRTQTAFVMKSEQMIFYEDIKNDVDEWFDTSNYEKDHPLFSNKNKKQVGFMKDECGGNKILRFVGL